MNKQLQNKLKSYSALTSIASLASFSVDGQIIHTTVNYTGGYETYEIDIDGDSNVDTRFFAGSNDPFTYDAPYSYYTLYCALSGPALKVVNSSFRYIQNLPSESLVDASQLDFAIGWKVLVGTVSYVNYPSNDFSFGDLSFVGSGDKFVGVKFDISGNIHYGWLRFTNISVDGTSWTLVDMAYESTPDKGILTGDTGIAVNVKESEKKYVSIFANKTAIKINTNDCILNAKVDVVNMLGQTVISSTINSDTNTFIISHSLESGMYIVRISNSQSDIMSRKIMF
jgi:hypothetical protein